MAAVTVQTQDSSRVEAQKDKAANEPDLGYPELAELMAKTPEVMIFRRHRRLTALNILRIQAELQNLERRLDEAITRDRESDDPVVRNYCNDFYSMRDNLEDQEDNMGESEVSVRDTEQITLLITIGEKLQEYKSAIETAKFLSGTPSPSKSNVEILQHRLLLESSASFLVDAEKETWGNTNTSDFMTIYPGAIGSDRFTRAIEGPFLAIYHRLWGHRKSSEAGYRQYSDQRIRVIGRNIGRIIASILPTLTILVLYFVHPPLIRIGLVIVFTAAFSLALSVFTAASAEGIFTSTATFAAVEVVFIGTSGNNTA